MTAIKLNSLVFQCSYASKGADGMPNSVGPDQTAQEQSDLGLQCLLSTSCPNDFLR